MTDSNDAEQAHALQSVNEMIDRWKQEPLLVPKPPKQSDAQRYSKTSAALFVLVLNPTINPIT